MEVIAVPGGTSWPSYTPIPWNSPTTNQIIGGAIMGIGGGIFAGGAIVTGGILYFEHILAIPSVGWSILMTPHVIAIGGNIIAIGGTITAIGWNIFNEDVCFAAGTLVYTVDGLKPIEEIKEGDLVYSKNEKTGEIALQKVKSLHVKLNTPIFKLKFATMNDISEQLFVTEEHPFWVQNKGWVEAKNLKSGDEVVTLDGELLEVLGNVIQEGRETVYNFEVEDFHTYFVSGSKILVHNSCKK